MPSGITPPHRRPGVSLGTEGADGTGRGSSTWCGNVWWYECIRTHWHLYRYILLHSIHTLIASLAFHAILVCKLYANPTCHAAREGTSSDMGAPAYPHPTLNVVGALFARSQRFHSSASRPTKNWMYIIYIWIYTIICTHLQATAIWDSANLRQDMRQDHSQQRLARRQNWTGLSRSRLVASAKVHPSWLVSLVGFD